MVAGRWRGHRPRMIPVPPPPRPRCRGRRGKIAMPMSAMPKDAPPPWTDAPATGRLILADGSIIAGRGLGASGSAVGEVCYNTAMTGYQEILTDPSYAGQIITFTFPHVGNVGTNSEDLESASLAVAGVRGAGLERLAENAQHHCHHRRRYARARGPDPREGYAECRHRACAGRQVRPRRVEARGGRMAGHGRARPCQGCHRGTELRLGRDRVAMGQRLWEASEPAL